MSKMSKLIIEKYFLATRTQVIHHMDWAGIHVQRNPCSKKYCYREIQLPSFFCCCYWVSVHSQKYYV